jgi:hypothetical protein
MKARADRVIPTSLHVLRSSRALASSGSAPRGFAVTAAAIHARMAKCRSSRDRAVPAPLTISASHLRPDGVGCRAIAATSSNGIQGTRPCDTVSTAPSMTFSASNSVASCNADLNCHLSKGSTVTHWTRSCSSRFRSVGASTRMCSLMATVGLRRVLGLCQRKGIDLCKQITQVATRHRPALD